jgi:RNA polymerase sigma factor (sigma-70 family)
MMDGATVPVLVVAARDGDAGAWDQIVERYAPLVWAICRRYGLDRPDTDDVGQNVWFSLFQHLFTIREPAALPGWLARTTGHECLRLLRANGQRERAERRVLPDDGDGYLDDVVAEELERAERHIALRQAFSQLRPRCQELLSALFREDRAPYRQISSELGMKVGSIGPTQQRCLAELRRCPALAALLARQREANGGAVDVRRVVER